MILRLCYVVFEVLYIVRSLSDALVVLGYFHEWRGQ